MIICLPWVKEPGVQIDEQEFKQLLSEILEEFAACNGVWRPEFEKSIYRLWSYCLIGQVGELMDMNRKQK